MYLVGWMGGWALSVLFPCLGLGPSAKIWEANPGNYQKHVALKFWKQHCIHSFVPPQLGSLVCSLTMAPKSNEGGNMFVSVLG